MSFPPRVVRARGVRRDEEIHLILAEQAWNHAVQEGDLEKIGQYLGLVSTGLPSLVQDRGLLGAHALWQGFERPANDDPNAPNHYAYILLPPTSFVFSRSIGDIREEVRPRDAVFMVSVWMPPSDEPMLAEWNRDSDVEISGQIQDWEWFTADLRETDQPSQPHSRFNHRHW